MWMYCVWVEVIVCGLCVICAHVSVFVCECVHFKHLQLMHDFDVILCLSHIHTSCSILNTQFIHDFYIVLCLSHIHTSCSMYKSTQFVHLLLLDVYMPGVVDGPHVLRCVLSHTRCSLQYPIHVCTYRSRERDLERERELRDVRLGTYRPVSSRDLIF